MPAPVSKNIPAVDRIEDPAVREAFRYLANMLEDMELRLDVGWRQKAWTPGVSFAVPGDLAVMYNFTEGVSRRIRDVVYAKFDISTATFVYTTSSGAFLITGIPYPVTVSANQLAIGTLQWSTITPPLGRTQVFPVASSAIGTSIFGLNTSGPGVGAAVLSAADIPTGTALRLRGSIIYLTS